MQHIAIMQRSWGFTAAILDGTKTIESRWYNHRAVPWNRVAAGDTVYFKDSGRPVTVRAGVDRVEQLADLTPERVRQVLATYGTAIGIPAEQREHYYKLFKTKRYCILLHLIDPQPVEPFEIDKRGFGAMAAWITVPSVAEVKRPANRTFESSRYDVGPQ